MELHRGSRGFGFSIRGGREFNNMPLFVLRIADGGAADLDGRLKVGPCGLSYGVLWMSVSWVCVLWMPRS